MKRSVAMMCLVAGAALAMAMAGCGTGYHAKGIGGGYSETQLGGRAYEVSFEGNGYTNQLTAQRGAMHRAAELAMQLGYAGFWVANQSSNVSSQLVSQPVTCSSPGLCSGGQSTLIQRPTSTMVVNFVTAAEMGSAPPGIIVYDAGYILAQQ